MKNSSEMSFDESGKTLVAVYFRVRPGTVYETREIGGGRAFADLSEDGLLLGVELLDCSGIKNNNSCTDCLP